jgi:hypothetical protein
MDNVAELWAGMEPANPIGRFTLGLMHDDSHLGHLADIVHQSHSHRNR